MTEFTSEQISRLAEYYHERECRRNHTDGCGWFWEKSPDYPSDSKWEHQYWEKRVLGLVERDRKNVAEIELILGRQFENHEAICRALAVAAADDENNGGVLEGVDPVSYFAGVEQATLRIANMFADNDKHFDMVTFINSFYAEKRAIKSARLEIK